MHLKVEDSDQTAWICRLSENKYMEIQSTIIISTSLISNNHLSRSENLFPGLTQRSVNRQQNIVEKRRNLLFSTIFSIYL